MAVVQHNEAVDRRRKGLALRALRKRLGFTQESAADAHKVTPQAWQNYEAGKRHLSDAKLSALVQSLGSDIEEFALELSKIPEAPEAKPVRRRMGVEERSFAGTYVLPVGGVAHGGGLRPELYEEAEPEVIDLERYFAAGTEILRLDGMSMHPYAEPGGFVTYNPRRPAQRGRGCVIVMKDGSKLVKRFEHYDDTTLVVTELWPEERRVEYPLADVQGVYAIGLRGD